MALNSVYNKILITDGLPKGESGLTLIYQTIENYIYFYHTDTLILLPNAPESISDQQGANWSSTSILGRSAPIQAYSYSNARSVTINLNFHREMLKQSNSANLYNNPKNLAGWGNDYIDYMTNMMYGSVIPNYATSAKMVDPPLVAIRFGKQIYCKGTISNVQVTYDGAILRDNNYSHITIGFTVTEVNPYDAITAMGVGGVRSDGAILMNTDLGRNYNIGKNNSNNGGPKNKTKYSGG